MSSFKLDQQTGDIEIIANKPSLTTGIDAIRQHLQTTLRLFMGEWFLDTTKGVPWFQDILIKNPSFAVVSAVLRNTILNTPGVLQLVEFNLDFDKSIREMSLAFKALTTEGLIDFTEFIEV